MIFILTSIKLTKFLSSAINKNYKIIYYIIVERKQTRFSLFIERKKIKRLQASGENHVSRRNKKCISDRKDKKPINAKNSNGCCSWIYRTANQEVGVHKLESEHRSRLVDALFIYIIIF